MLKYMNIESSINKIIDDMSDTLNNDFIMQQIVAILAKKINKSAIIKPQYKIKIKEHIESHGIYVIPKCDCNNMLYPSKILLRTIIYFVSDLNVYDYNLINFLFDASQNPADVIIVLFLNNITDIKTYCIMHDMNLNETQTIITLKKLSALYKLKYNF